jgi:uncharacterized coiled-coil protein SlyX
MAQREPSPGETGTGEELPEAAPPVAKRPPRAKRVHHGKLNAYEGRPAAQDFGHLGFQYTPDECLQKCKDYLHRPAYNSTLPWSHFFTARLTTDTTYSDCIGEARFFCNSCTAGVLPGVNPGSALKSHYLACPEHPERRTPVPGPSLTPPPDNARIAALEARIASMEAQMAEMNATNAAMRAHLTAMQGILGHLQAQVMLALQASIPATRYRPDPQ